MFVLNSWCLVLCLGRGGEDRVFGSLVSMLVSAIKRAASTSIQGVLGVLAFKLLSRAVVLPL